MASETWTPANKIIQLESLVEMLKNETVTLAKQRDESTSRLAALEAAVETVCNGMTHKINAQNPFVDISKVKGWLSALRSATKGAGRVALTPEQTPHEDCPGCQVCGSSDGHECCGKDNCCSIGRLPVTPPPKSGPSELLEKAKNRWEHKTENSGRIGVAECLNQGDDGWQICALDGMTFVYKRRVHEQEHGE